MAEMLDFGGAGRMVPPHDPGKLAETITELLAAPDLRRCMGERARQRLLDEYNLDRICNLQELSYKRAIERRNAAGQRAL
jgi:glycosyltransferase involved in cell wall biosynthesis